MNILKNEVNTNININQSYMPTLTDIGAAVVFGLGFYFFKIHLSKKPEETEAVQNEKPQKDPYLPIREKINNALTKWESQMDFNRDLWEYLLSQLCEPHRGSAITDQALEIATV